MGKEDANKQVDGESHPDNLWDKILSEASRSITDRLETRNVLILGDRSSGKSALLARLQGVDISEVGKGLALDYSFIDITSPDDDEIVSRLNVWLLEGDPEYKNLLKFALNRDNIEHSLVIITLDLSQPWTLVESLTRWLGVLEQHIQQAVADKDDDFWQELKKSLIYDFQQYTEPQLSASSTPVPGTAASGTTTATGTTQRGKKKHPIDEQLLLPLTEGLLTKNLGVPILIVGCKSDVFDALEKEHGYRDGHFDYVQQYLRRICLQYGASLLYTSAKKEDGNFELLFQYMRHLLYYYDFTAKPQVLERELTFIPIGADSMSKIKIDFENQSLTRDFDEPYSEVIRIPKKLQKNLDSGVETKLVAEEDQDFLANHKEALDKLDAASDKKKSGLGDTLKKLGGTVTPAPTPTTLTSDVPSLGTSSTLPSPSLATSGPKSPTTPTSAAAAAPSALADGKDASSEHQVLANFFNSLIQKDRNPLSRKPLTDFKTTAPLSPSAPGASREEVAKQLDRLKNKYQKDT